MPCNLTENNKIMTSLGVAEEENDLFLNFSDGYLKTNKEKKNKMQNVEKPQRTQRGRKGITYQVSLRANKPKANS